MKRNEYRLDVLKSLYTRLGYVESIKKDNLQFFTHPVSGNEILLDTSYPVVVAALMERKVNDDLKIDLISFESLFDAEIQQFLNNNTSHE